MAIQENTLRDFYIEFAALDLGWLEPIRDFVAMHALDNASDSKEADKVNMAICTAIGFRDQPDFATEIFSDYNGFKPYGG